MASSVVKKQALGFMDLPGEMRNMIYSHLLISPVENLSEIAATSSTSDSSGKSLPSIPHVEQSNTESNGNNATMAASDEADKGGTTTPGKFEAKKTESHSFHPAILATNRSIYTEATLLLYSLNTFTITINTARIFPSHAPSLLLSPNRHLPHTRSWTVVIDLVASTPESWHHQEKDYRETVNEACKLVDIMTGLVREVCETLEHLKRLETVRIEIVGAYFWEVRSRYAGIGMEGLLEAFGKVRAKEVQIEGARALVRERSISEVRNAMLEIVEPAPVEVSGESRE